jgi:hypothetical protein
MEMVVHALQVVPRVSGDVPRCLNLLVMDRLVPPRERRCVVDGCQPKMPTSSYLACTEMCRGDLPANG